MAVIGVHEILLVPSMKGTQAKIGRELDRAAGPAGERAGRTMGSRLGGALRTGALVAGTAAVAGIGTALTKGFGRLTQIENARAKLSGLGHEAGTVQTIMDDALAAVKGTSFGMGEAATIAASAVAAGIKPGKDLQRTLKLTGDAATIAGTDIGSMGSIVNKVATADMMQLDVANQLMDAGIPILQMVAEEMGVTAGEARDLASEGKVSFETFQAALEEGLGGAALKSGDTLQGAMKNAMAAVGRFGANLLEGVYPKLRTFFTAFQDWMGPVEEMGKVIGERLGTALEDLASWIKNDAMPALRDFGDWVRDNREPIGLVAGAVAGMMGAFALYQTVQGVVGWIHGVAGAMGLLSAAMAANPIGLIVVAIGALVGAAVWAYSEVEWFRDVVDEAFRVIGEVATNVWENFLRPAFEGIAGFVRNTLGPAIEWLWENVVSPIFGFIGTTIKDAWELVIKPALDSFWAFIRDDLGPVIESFWAIVEPIWNDVAKVIKDTWAEIEPILSDFKSFIENELAPAFTHLSEKAVRPAMATIGTIIKARMNTSAEQMGGLKNYMDNEFGPAFKTLYEARVKPNMKRMGESISDMVKWAKPFLGQFEKGITHALVTNVANAVQGFATIWSSLKRTFATPVNWVIRNVLNPLIDAFNRISDAVNGPTIKRIVGLGDAATSKGNTRGAGGITSVGMRAKGGPVQGGRPYIVGEEGPELIWPDKSGYVSTAEQTEKLMRQGKDLPEHLSQAAAGRHPREAVAPMGDGMGGALGRGVQWLVGELAGSVRKLIDPALNAMSSNLSGYGLMGQMTSAMARKAVESVLGFADKKDAAFGSGAVFEGQAGNFFKPSSGVITSRYGPRWGRVHEGIDIAAGAAGAAIKAAWNGVVQKTGWNIGPGRSGIGALLNHGNRWSYYGHMRPGSLAVQPGQKVKAGQQIGWQGTTGNSTGVHVHFEEHRGKAWNSVNPGYLFRDQGGNLPPGLNMVLNNRKRDETILPMTPRETEAAFLRQGNGRTVEQHFHGPSAHEVAELAYRREQFEMRKVGV